MFRVGIDIRITSGSDRRVSASELETEPKERDRNDDRGSANNSVDESNDAE